MFSYTRRCALLCALLLALSASCKPAEEAEKTVKDGTKTMLAQPDRARVLSDLVTLRKSIQEYYAINSAYPPSLNDLKLSLNSPDDLVYDAATGKVQSKTFPNL